MVCGGKGGSSIENNCSSDSGGPLVCPSGDGTWTLQGVVSFGDYLCRPGKYTVYARVSEFRRWIRRNTGKLNQHRTIFLSVKYQTFNQDMQNYKTVGFVGRFAAKVK